MKWRLLPEVRKLLVLLLVGFAYYIFVFVTGIYIPCLFREVTGFKCPGCGISHMLVAVLKLDFASAFEHNGLLLVMLPFAVAAFGVSEYRYIVYGTRGFKGCRVLVYAAAAALILFGIIRNV